MAKLGKNIIVTYDGSAIAGISDKSNGAHSECGMIPCASDTDSEWEHFKPGRRSWSIDSSYLVLSSAGVQVLLNTGTRYLLVFKDKNGGTGQGVKGYAYLTVCDIQAVNGNIANGAFKFVGDGPLISSDSNF
jgi:hypothetical protein